MFNMMNYSQMQDNVAKGPQSSLPRELLLRSGLVMLENTPEPRTNTTASPCTGTLHFIKLQYSTVQYSTVQNIFPMYRSSSGLFLYKHTNDKWSANSVINERGVLRGTLSFLVSLIFGSSLDYCMSLLSGIWLPCEGAWFDWKYWDDEEWKPGNINVTCANGEERSKTYNIPYV